MEMKLVCMLLVLLCAFGTGSTANVPKKACATKQVTVNCNCGSHSRFLMVLLLSMNKKLNACLAKQGGGNKKAPKNCLEVLKRGGKKSGVYRIKPDYKGSFQVYCDQKTLGGGWVVIQRRKDGSVNFFRNWEDYKNGFGHLKGEFWLGLDKIHRLTHQAKNELRVELEDTKGNTAYANYKLFSVANENLKYKLLVGKYSGTAGDSLTYHSGQPFSTKDRDNDANSGNCAASYKGAWWYNSCHLSNLNGLYLLGHHKSFANGVNWKTWKGYHYSAKRAEMKIRPEKKT